MYFVLFLFRGKYVIQQHSVSYHADILVLFYSFELVHHADATKRAFMSIITYQAASGCLRKTNSSYPDALKKAFQRPFSYILRESQIHYSPDITVLQYKMRYKNMPRKAVPKS